VKGRELGDYRESDPSPRQPSLHIAFESAVRFPYLFSIRGGNSRTLIGDRKESHPLRPSDDDPNGLPNRSIFDRVVQKVHDDSGDRVAISDYVDSPRCRDEKFVAALLEEWRDRVEAFFQSLREVEALSWEHTSGGPAKSRKLEDVLDQMTQPPRLTVDHRNRALLVFDGAQLSGLLELGEHPNLR
jgi:hypothetical protein